MKKSLLLFTLMCLISLGAFQLGVLSGRNAPGDKSSQYSKEHQAMHHNDAAQDISMPHDSASPNAAVKSSGGKTEPVPGTVRINPAKQQLIGVQTGAAEIGSQTQVLRTTGKVIPDENRLYRMTAAVDGWIRDINGSTTGSLVQKDQVMATYFTIEFLNKQQQYLYALDLAERKKRFEAERSGTKEFHLNAPYSRDISFNDITSVGDPVELSRVELLLMGVSEKQIEEITRKREYASNIELRAPVTGIVLSRKVYPNYKLDRGTETFVIADLRSVWIAANFYDHEAESIQPGLSAKITLPKQARIFDAIVSDVPPQFDPSTGSYKVRLEVDNPDFALRPEMFVNVELFIIRPPALTIPQEAVLDSGHQKNVFVDQGGGFFEPRTVETGWRSHDRIEITRGLSPGERVVVSGNFLIDSESRFAQAGPGSGHGSHAGAHSHHVKETADSNSSSFTEHKRVKNAADPKVKTQEESNHDHGAHSGEQSGRVDQGSSHGGHHHN